VEWYFAILLMFGCLVILMMTGMPISFAFMFSCVMGALLFWGGWVGLEQLSMSIFSSVANYNFLPIPLFILMGDVIFSTGSGFKLIDAVDKLLGRLPGRLSILAMGAATLVGSMSGVSGGTIAMLGRVLVPEMTKRGYKKAMTLGPIVATGTLDCLIPPSALAVFLGAVGQVSVGNLLLAIVVPGLALVLLYSAYIIIRCTLDPSLAPSYEVPHVPFKKKLKVIATEIAPISVVVFAVLGSVFFGVATPGESAALGVMGCIVLALIYKKFSWKAIGESARSTIRTTVMVFFIVVGSISFGRILATTGALQELIGFSTGLDVHPMVIIIATQLVLLFMGCFMDPASIVMITAPIFFPLVRALGYDTLWFAVISVLNIQLGLITPPFGLDVFTMKAIAPPDVTLGDVFRSSMPFLFLGILMMVMILVFPPLATWLPGLAGK
jgi:tripartite ATP-independent transporter DctM subunit